DLRHSHATHMLASGVHPKIAQERLGHSSVGITLDLYSHVLPGMQAEAVSKVDAALRDALDRRTAKKKWEQKGSKSGIARSNENKGTEAEQRLRSVAQWLEHRSPKPGVGGSSPSTPARRSPARPTSLKRNRLRPPARHGRRSTTWQRSVRSSSCR